MHLSGAFLEYFCFTLGAHGTFLQPVVHPAVLVKSLCHILPGPSLCTLNPSAVHIYILSLQLFGLTAFVVQDGIPQQQVKEHNRLLYAARVDEAAHG